MGLLDETYSTVGAKKPRKSDRIMPGEELNFRGLLDAATNVPIAGDALSGFLAAYDATKGDYGSAAANALGVLPFVSAGMVKGTGKIADALNAKHGEKLDAYLSEGNKGINLSKIVVPKESRNSGVGTEFMNDLVSMADKEGKTLTLTPSSDFGGSKARLQEFYKRFGFVPNKGRTKDFEISEAMYRNPVEQPKIESGLLDDVRPMTEYEQRHLTAQKNAALPVEQGGLGLPPNNTAMDRARAMGFSQPFYHGTGKDFRQFDISKGGMHSQGAGSREGALGVWGSDNPEVAGTFADWSSRGQGTSNVMPMLAKMDNPLEVAKYSEVKDLIDRHTQFARPDMQIRMMQDKINPEAARAELFSNGNDSIALRNTLTDSVDGQTPINQFVALKPENLRSRFAAFDPMRRHEADLLGYADPYLLGGIASGGLLGLGAYNYAKD